MLETMQNELLEEFLSEAKTWGIVAIFPALMGGGLALWLRHCGQPLLPPRRSRAAAWGGLEIILFLFLAQIVVPALLYLMLRETGFFQWIYGADFQITTTNDNPTSAARMGIWGALLSFPISVFLV